MQPGTVVPSHGPVGEGALIGINRGVMLDIQARVKELKAQGRSADETATTVQTEFQARFPKWTRANGIGPAARAAYAELP
jgi:hypothetical protein